MKKILYFIQLPPPLHGVTKINKFVYESKLINKNFITDLLEIRYSDNLSQLQKISFNKIFRHIIIAYKLTKKLLAFKPDYVYFTIVPTGIGFYKDLLFLLIIKLFHSKPVLHLHGKGIEERTRNKLTKKVYKIAFSNNNIIHLSKNLLKKELGNLNLKDTKLCFVENGVEEVNIQKNDFYDKTDKINILFLSNLFESKGIFVALEAFKKVSKSRNNTILHLVGGMSDEKTEKKIKDIISGNNLNVKIHGALYGSLKYKVLSMADIFIHPTLNDAFPLVLLEAMQFELPVISTYQGAIPDIVENNSTGFLVKENDAKKLGERMMYLIENPKERARMGQNGYLKYKKKYTLQQFESNMAETFNRYLI